MCFEETDKKKGAIKSLGFSETGLFEAKEKKNEMKRAGFYWRFARPIPTCFFLSLSCVSSSLRKFTHSRKIAAANLRCSLFASLSKSKCEERKCESFRRDSLLYKWRCAHAEGCSVSFSFTVITQIYGLNIYRASWKLLPLSHTREHFIICWEKRKHFCSAARVVYSRVG